MVTRRTFLRSIIAAVAASALDPARIWGARPENVIVRDSEIAGIRLTRAVIINDDLDAFCSIPHFSRWKAHGPD